MCRHIFSQERSHVKCCAFHKTNSVLVTGFSNGVFTLHEMPGFNSMHALKYVIIS